MIDYEYKYVGSTIADLAGAMKRLNEQHAEIKKQAAVVWAEYDYLRMQAIPKKMADMDIESVKIAGVGRLSIRQEAGCKTLNKGALMEWFREHDLADMIQEVVNASTLKAFVREQIREGGEIPGEDVIEFNPYDVASITKS